MSQGEADPNINPTEAGMTDETTETEKNTEPDMPEKAGAERAGKRQTGYKNPPEHTRFKPGQSGNPKGRPKKSKNLKTVLLDELNEPVEIREGGKTRRVPKLQAMVKRLSNNALNGSERAIARLTDLYLRLVDVEEDDVTGEAPLTADERQVLETFKERLLRKAANASQ